MEGWRERDGWDSEIETTFKRWRYSRPIIHNKQYFYLTKNMINDRLPNNNIYPVSILMSRAVNNQKKKEKKKQFNSLIAETFPTDLDLQSSDP